MVVLNFGCEIDLYKRFFFSFPVDQELEDISPPVFESTDGGYDADKQLEGIKLLKGQFWALIVKRFHHLRRNRKAFISQVERSR